MNGTNDSDKVDFCYKEGNGNINFELIMKNSHNYLKKFKKGIYTQKKLR